MMPCCECQPGPQCASVVLPRACVKAVRVLNEFTGTTGSSLGQLQQCLNLLASAVDVDYVR